MWEISFLNLTMLMATVPVYKSEDEKQSLEEKFTRKDGVIDFGNDVQSLANFINNQK